MSDYITHLAADTANGVYTVDPIDFPEADWELSESSFTDKLDALEDGEMAFFAADPDQLDRIKDAYAFAE